MIFPTETILQLRSQLEDRVTSGELSEAEAYREALAADPDDPRAVRFLALLAEDEGDFDGAGSLAWRWLRADPLSHEVFRLIGRLLRRDPSQAARAAAYLALGRTKLHFDPEAEEDPEPAPLVVEGEPPEVTHELAPHRLLHEMWISSTGEVDREVIEAVLERGADMAPLLTGILNLYGEDLLDDVDEALVVRSMTLLGEIGDPAAIAAMARFFPVDSETFSQASSWAFQRIAFRRPVETLRELSRVIPSAGAFDLAAIAQQICMMPPTSGRIEALLAMEARIVEFKEFEQAAVATSLITAAYVMEGLDSLLGARLVRDHGDQLPGEARKELKLIRGQLKGEGPYVAEEDTASVYDICCPGFDPAEEDEPYVRSGPKLGRNEPCWCGSGKKYKKCHLAADESK
jgi:SEC-C motif